MKSQMIVTVSRFHLKPKISVLNFINELSASFNLKQGDGQTNTALPRVLPSARDCENALITLLIMHHYLELVLSY